MFFYLSLFFVFQFTDHKAFAAVQTDVLKNVSTSTYPYKLLRIKDGAGLETYALWIPPKYGNSVVLMTQPYTGIDWTGLQLDTNVAAMPDAKTLGIIEDLYGPLYEAGKSQKIFYSYKTPDEIIPEGIPFLVNGMGVLFVFERFYAGGSMLQDANETALALEFLGTQASVDPQMIGIWGASWGGFEALHGAARAKANVKPKYGVAWMPMINVGRFWNDITKDYYVRFQSNPSSQTLAYVKLEPYARRAAVSAWSTTTQSMDFSKFGPAFLSNNLTTRFLILHDEWDTIVPKEHTLDLVASMTPSRIDSFIVPRATPIDYSRFTIDHFPVKETPNYDNWGSAQFAYAYLIERLAPRSASYWVSYYDSNELWALLTHMKTIKMGGRNINSIVQRLIDLCDPKLKLADITGNIKDVLDGKIIVSVYVNAVFGLTTTPENVATYLQTSGL